jgi:hypothetical protein
MIPGCMHALRHRPQWAGISETGPIYRRRDILADTFEQRDVPVEALCESAHNRFRNYYTRSHAVLTVRPVGGR